MMFPYPVLLGLLWSIYVVPPIQAQINDETNKVYSYTYHFQHNGTTNSKEIIQNFLGNSGFGDESSDGQIVKTIANPDIRGFFIKGVLPAGPISGSNNYRSPGYTSNNAIDNIKKIVHQNLQPPHREVVTGLLPASPDLPNSDYNTGNDVGSIFQNQNFPQVPPLPVVPTINNNNENVVSRVQSYSRGTRDGGNVVGNIETFEYNPPPVTNSVSRSEENAHGYRQNENIVNNNQVTGYRTQSYFRQHFRTITPDINSGITNSFHQDNSIGSNVGGLNNGNNWWNVLSDNKVNNEGQHQQVNHNMQQHRALTQHVGNDINNQFNNVFGRRLSNANNVNRNGIGGNRGIRHTNLPTVQNPNHNVVNNNNNNNINNVFNNNNENHNTAINNNVLNDIVDNGLFNNDVARKNNLFNTPVRNSNVFNNPSRNSNNVYNPPANNNGYNNHVNNNNNFLNNPINNVYNRPVSDNRNTFNNPATNNRNLFNNPVRANVFNNVGTNKNAYPKIQLQIRNEDTAKNVMNLINSVNSQLNRVRDDQQGFNNVGLTWDDDNGNVNHDWSMRQRPFSNAHSEPQSNNGNTDALKTTLEALVGREIHIPPIPDIGNNDNGYSNRNGGGVEKFFGVDKVVEGPNSFSRNQQRGYERNFEVNNNRGYQRTNQWSTNTVRRNGDPDIRADFSKDFIDLFRDDY